MRFQGKKKLFLLSLCAALFLTSGCKNELKTGKESSTAIESEKRQQSIATTPRLTIVPDRTDNQSEAIVASDATADVSKLLLFISPEELQPYSNPKVGVTLNNGTETVFTIDKTTGYSGTGLELPVGTNNVKLSFINGKMMIGKSLPDQETLTVTGDPNEQFAMGFIPLEARFNFSLVDNGGLATMTVRVPETLVNLVNGVENLKIGANLMLGNNLDRHTSITVEDTPSGYTAKFTFNKVTYGSYKVGLWFKDNRNGSRLGLCHGLVNLSVSSSGITSEQSCSNLRVARQFDSNDELLNSTQQESQTDVNSTAYSFFLSSVHFRIVDQDDNPLTDAIIGIAEAQEVITSKDSFGGEGYAHAYLSSGKYTFSVSHEQDYIWKEVTIDRLQSQDVLIKLEKQIGIPLTPPRNRLALGSSHSCFVKDNGTVKCWGIGEEGQIGNGKNELYNPVPEIVSGLNNPIMLSASMGTTCALTQNRRVVCWGDDENGNLGNDHLLIKQNTPVEVLGLRDVQSIAVGPYHSCALMNDQTAQCWGDNAGDFQYLGFETSANSIPTPRPIPNLQGIRSIAIGDNVTCMQLNDDTVRCWGKNRDGQLGTGNLENQITPQIIPGLVDVVDLASGFDFMFARLADGSLKSWGRNQSFQLGHSEGNIAVVTPITVPFNLSGIKQLVPGYGVTNVLMEDGTVLYWGAGYDDQASFMLKKEPTKIKTEEGSALTGVKELASGLGHSCVWLGGNQVKCWGDNWYGQIGNGKTHQTDPNDHSEPNAVTVKRL